MAIQTHRWRAFTGVMFGALLCIGQGSCNENFNDIRRPVDALGADGSRNDIIGAPCVAKETRCVEGQLLACVDGAFAYKETCSFGCSADACSKAMSVALGASHSCVVLEDASLRCWGDNTWGQLGTGKLELLVEHPTRPLLEKVKSVSLGKHHTCALGLDGTVHCWGNNERGQLGDGHAGEGVYERTPVVVPIPAKVEQIALGEAHSCARTGDGVYCWGDAAWGQLGDGVSGASMFSSKPTLVKSIKRRPTRIAAGWSRSGAILDDGSVVLWGKTLTDGDADGAASPLPVALSDAKNVVDLAWGDEHLCLQTTGDEVLCVGRNDVGQLGAPPSQKGSLSLLPVQGVSPVKGLAAAEGLSCVLRSTAVRCWGGNDAHPFGVSALTMASEPTAVKPLPEIDAFDTGWKHLCGLNLHSGKVLCWGSNTSGQLGQGMQSPFETPAEVLDQSLTSTSKAASADH